MYNETIENEKETQVPLLPFGEMLRSLISASSLNEQDLKFVLQNRGIFIKDHRKNNTIPKLTTILLSPREFNILKNRQQFKESTIKTLGRTANWNSTKTIVQTLPDECENFAKNLIDENSSYELKDCRVQYSHPNEVVFFCIIKRNDWTKDVFSQTSYHECKLTVIKEQDTNIVTYFIERTSNETRDFMNKLQNALHNNFQKQGVILNNAPIQKILANHFVSNKTRFEFLKFFTKKSDFLIFEKIIDIDAGIEHNFKEFPEKFRWLKGNIDRISLHGNKIHETDVMELSNIGALKFGEIEADFKFQYSDAKGECIIKYGFSSSYNKEKPVEFESKIINLKLHPNYAHVSRHDVQNFLLKQFQKKKHQLFEEFKKEKKVDTQKYDLVNQHEFEFNS